MTRIASTRLLLALLPSLAAPAFAETPTQIWFNFTAGKTYSERWYVELDVEPKVQITEDEEWRNLDLTPLIEFYPNGWLDLSAAIAVGNTHQRDGLDTFEITPKLGANFHPFDHMSKRWQFAGLVRVESRNFYYSDDTPNEHKWRARLRLGAKAALNRANISEDGTYYAIADGEFYWPFGEDVSEVYANKFRARLGIGLRHAKARRFELIFIRDWNRSSPYAESSKSLNAVDLKYKMLF